MATVPEFTNQGIPSDGNPSPFPSFGNFGAPYMVTLSLLGLSIGLPVWLFSPPVISNTQITSEPRSPSHTPSPPHVNLKVDPFNYSPASAPCSSSLLGEGLNSSN